MSGLKSNHIERLIELLDSADDTQLGYIRDMVTTRITERSMFRQRKDSEKNLLFQS